MALQLIVNKEGKQLEWNSKRYKDGDYIYLKGEINATVQIKLIADKTDMLCFKGYTRDQYNFDFPFDDELQSLDTLIHIVGIGPDDLDTIFPMTQIERML